MKTAEMTEIEPNVPERTTDVAVLTTIEQPVTLLPSEAPPAKKFKPRHRAYSVEKRKNFDTVDIEVPGGIQTVRIPAVQFTKYWAILKFMYLNHSRRIYHDRFCAGVQEIMSEESKSRDKWQLFIAKKTVITCTGARDEVRLNVTQDAKDWESRLISNGRNLTRLGGENAYGQRLVDVGHVLRYETQPDGRGYFILHLTLDNNNTVPLKRGRKPRVHVPGCNKIKCQCGKLPLAA